jgi:hypothetical protein
VKSSGSGPDAVRHEILARCDMSAVGGDTDERLRRNAHGSSSLLFFTAVPMPAPVIATSADNRENFDDLCLGSKS